MVPAVHGRGDQGAVAIMVAVLALAILGAGAFAVDMGQVYAKRSALQSNVDLAVLAAAAELDGSNTCTPTAVAIAEDYLTMPGNQVDGQVTVDLDDDPATAAGQRNGVIVCDGWRVQLTAPKAEVDFGMAKALDPGNEGLDVPAFAAAGVSSPDTGVMPAFAVSGCDSGPQTLLDDSSPGPLPTPGLPGGATDSANPAITISGLAPSEIAVNAITDLKISGNNKLADATHVGFSTPSADSALHHSYPVTTAASGLVTLASVPSSVTSVEDVWYVRVSRDNGATWSNALPFRVGDAVLECASTPTDGNFGALLLYRNPDTNANDRLALNMALGLDFTVTTYPTPAFDWLCSDGIAPAVVSTNSVLRDGTNCVDTDTGLPAQASEAGLLTGVGGEKGRFDATVNPSNPACGRSDRPVDFGGSTGLRTLNDEILTCYFTDSTTRIDDIGTGYTGAPVISSDIFRSPRFFWVPVLGVEPSGGGSQHYQIVDFRPAFIADQADSATRDNPQVVDDPALTENGLGFKVVGGAKKLRSLRVIFFDVEALPESVEPGGAVMPYLGVGPKIITLVE